MLSATSVYMAIKIPQPTHRFTHQQPKDKCKATKQMEKRSSERNSNPSIKFTSRLQTAAIGGRSARNKTEINSIERTMPSYLSNLKPGEVDCPCLLHCKKKRREIITIDNLPIYRENNFRSCKTKLALDNSLFSKKTQLPPFTADIVQEICEESSSSHGTSSSSHGTQAVKHRSVGIQTDAYEPRGS